MRLRLLTVVMYMGLGSVFPANYTNSGAWYNNPAPKGYRAIDILVQSNQARLAGVGKKFSTTVDGANATEAYQWYYNDYPFNWIDIGRVIEPRHRALGFVDFLVTVEMEDAPGISRSGPGTAPNVNTWSMQGDSDKKDSQDLRAAADGQVCEFLDTRYKASYYYNYGYFNYDSGYLAITHRWGFRNTTKSLYAGEYCILRFEAPRNYTRTYALFLGANVLRGSAYALSYQANVYVPVLTNSVVPVVTINSPALDGVMVPRFDNNANVFRPPLKDIRIPVRVPVQFSGEKSYVSNTTITSWEWQIDTPYWVPGGSTYTAFFITNGTYQVLLRLKTADGQEIVNTGFSNETGSNNMPDLCPSPLPMFVTVADPPNTASLSDPRPNPFFLGQNEKVFFDFTLNKDQAVTFTIFSLAGQLIKNVLTSQGKYPAGYWTANWDGKDDRGNFVTEGIYYGVLTTPSGSYLNKIHVLRVK